MSVMAKKPPKAVKIELPSVTREIVAQAKLACAEFKRAQAAQREAEKARDAALGELFVIMGFGSLQAVKNLSPAELAREIARRSGREFCFAAGARDFGILKTWEGRFPRWKDVLVSISPQQALEVERETPLQYSYTIIDAPSVADPNVICVAGKLAA
jgi:hypothetical protein